MKMYLEEINGQEVYYADGDWVVEDEYGITPYASREEARQAAEEGFYIEDDYTGNMPCDTYGMCAGSSCSHYYQCQA